MKVSFNNYTPQYGANNYNNSRKNNFSVKYTPAFSGGADTVAESVVKKSKFFKRIAKKFEKAYSNLNTVQKAALISFYYNLGIYFKAPKMEANLRAGKLKEAAKEFLDCDNTTVKGVKQKSPGLTKRRKIEHDLFIKNIK